MTEMVLKPCPFCGGNAGGPLQIGDGPAYDTYEAFCIGRAKHYGDGCGAATSYHADANAAIAAWNTRAAPSSPVGEGVREKVARHFSDMIALLEASPNPGTITAQDFALGAVRDLEEHILALLSTGEANQGDAA